MIAVKMWMDRRFQMGTEVEMAYRRAKLAKYCVDVLGSLRVNERRRVGNHRGVQARSKRPKNEGLG